MKMKKNNKPSRSRSERRGMSLDEWRKQNTQPWVGHGNLDEEDVQLINALWEEGQGRGIAFRRLAELYFPNNKDLHSASAQLSYELRCCRGLSEALLRLHHPPRSSRFTCAQVEQIFLLYGGVPE